MNQSTLNDAHQKDGRRQCLFHGTHSIVTRSSTLPPEDQASSVVAPTAAPGCGASNSTKPIELLSKCSRKTNAKWRSVGGNTGSPDRWRPGGGIPCTSTTRVQASTKQPSPYVGEATSLTVQKQSRKPIHSERPNSDRSTRPVTHQASKQKQKPPAKRPPRYTRGGPNNIPVSHKTPSQNTQPSHSPVSYTHLTLPTIYSV